MTLSSSSARQLGKPESLITYVTDRKGHDMRYAIDPTKIHNELGWLPETKFEDGIKKTIQWYLDNQALVGEHCLRRISELLSRRCTASVWPMPRRRHNEGFCHWRGWSAGS